MLYHVERAYPKESRRMTAERMFGQSNLAYPRLDRFHVINSVLPPCLLAVLPDGHHKAARDGKDLWHRT